MRPRSYGSLGSHNAPFLILFFLFLTFLLGVATGSAQTTQPFLFAETYNSSAKSTGFVTLLRNGTTGVLTLLSNTAVSFKDPCNPTAIDPTGRFLFGACGEGLAMYTLDSTTGTVVETPTSPYFASVSTGQNGLLVAAESTGQYVYLLKVGTAQPPLPSTFTLDTFSIDATTPALVAVSSQTLSLNGSWVGSVADPSQLGMFIYVNQDQGGTSPVALLYSISFDPSSGLANIPTAGLNIGNNARGIAVSPSGGYLAVGWGDTEGSLTVYRYSTTAFNLALVGSVNLGLEDGSYGSYSFPDSIYFSPGGNVLYAQAPPANFTGDGGLPFLVFEPSSVTQLTTAPIQVADATFLNGVVDPQAPFTYVGNPGPTTYGISVFEVDLSTGLPSQPSLISSPFYPQMDLTPLFVTATPGAQGIQGPTLGITPSALAFPATIPGQTSSPQNIILKSLGNESVSLSSIQISGSNASEFSESDNCMSSPVLPTNHTCTIAVTYTPTAVGNSQAMLFVLDNAAGNPQSIPLSGAAVAPPTPAPTVTLNPATTLTFPGTPTQGTSTLPQNVSLTNSGNAPLQIFSAVLSGFNAPDFSISSDNCSGAIAANASCTISVIFSPLAAGIRTAILTITDNAANSPQSVTVNGTAIAAATIAPAANGAVAVSVSAGQTAQYNLQATPGSGFIGVLNFTCSGAPTGASCNVPANVPVANGAASPFAVNITTSGSAAFVLPRIPRLPCLLSLRFVVLAFFAGFVALYLVRLRRAAWLLPFAALLVISCLNGCGGGGSSSAGQPPPVVTPSGTYTITVTPLATASGSSKQLSLNAVSLQLTVK